MCCYSGWLIRRLPETPLFLLKVAEEEALHFFRVRNKVHFPEPDPGHVSHECKGVIILDGVLRCDLNCYEVVCVQRRQEITFISWLAEAYAGNYQS